MKNNIPIREHRSVIIVACIVFGLMAGAINSVLGQNLIAHWKLDETAGPTYADTSTNHCTLYQDPNTTTAITAAGINGNSQWLNWNPTPGTSTRLYATNSALQADSFGFSFWILPTWINQYDNLMVKEDAYDTNSPGYARFSWQVHFLGDNGSGAAPIELIVRGTNGGFFGVVQSSTAIPLGNGATNWIHIAGGYDATNGTISLYVDGQQVQNPATPGAVNSDGSPLSIGTAKNGPNDYVAFAAGVDIDDVQIYDSPLSPSNVGFLRFNPGLVLGQNVVKAHWKLDELAGPTYADSSANHCPLYQDTNTTAAVVGAGIDGNSQWLNWSPTPGTSTRLYATNAAIQNDSFGFSFWIKPTWINQYDNLMVKEDAYDNVSPGYAREAWQVYFLGDNGSNAAPIEFIVRGTNGGFFGVVASSTAIPLGNAYTNWIHIAGGYDSIAGTLSLYVDGVANTNAGTPGANNSDGSPLSIGTAKNGPNDYVAFAAGVNIDDVQMYGYPLAPSAVAFLRANPGLELGQLKVKNFTYSNSSGNAALSFSSLSAQGYTVWGATNLAGGFMAITNPPAIDGATPVALPKSLLDQMFGSSARPQLLLRVSTP